MAQAAKIGGSRFSPGRVDNRVDKRLAGCRSLSAGALPRAAAHRLGKLAEQGGVQAAWSKVPANSGSS